MIFLLVAVVATYVSWWVTRDILRVNKYYRDDESGYGELMQLFDFSKYFEDSRKENKENDNVKKKL